MTIRFYLSPVVTVPGPMAQPQTIPTAATYPITGFSGVFDITGTDAWVLCVVEAADHTPILADATCAALPDLPLNGSLTIPKNRTDLSNALKKFAIDARVTFAAGDLFGTVLKKIGSLNMSVFNEVDLNNSVS